MRRGELERSQLGWGCTNCVLGSVQLQTVPPEYGYWQENYRERRAMCVGGRRGAQGAPGCITESGHSQAVEWPVPAHSQPLCCGVHFPSSTAVIRGDR